MALIVAVSVAVSDGETDYISVVRSESVQAVAAGNPEEVTQRDVDLVDLARAALDRISGDVLCNADAQVVQLRGILEDRVTKAPEIQLSIEGHPEERVLAVLAGAHVSVYASRTRIEDSNG